MWCSGSAEKLANHYLAIYPNSRITKTSRHGKGTPEQSARVITAMLGMIKLDAAALQNAYEG